MYLVKDKKGNVQPFVVPASIIKANPDEAYLEIQGHEFDLLDTEGYDPEAIKDLPLVKATKALAEKVSKDAQAAEVKAKAELTKKMAKV